MDFTTSCALARVDVVPDQATAAFAYLVVEEPSGANRSKASIIVVGGTLQLRKEMQSIEVVASEPYSATMHRWWRVRTDVGAIAWETSPDRLTWTTHHTEAAFFPLATAQLVLGAGTEQAAANAGTAVFDAARIFVP